MPNAGFRAAFAVLVMLLPAGAHAALTLTKLELDVQIQATNGVDSSFTVKFTVTGTEIATATVTPQGAGGSAINVPCTAGTTCTVTQNLTQTEFNQLFPATARDYKLDLTQVSPGTETITDTVSFTLPTVPSPAISAPQPGQAVDPTSLEVKFSACSACTQQTKAALLQGTTEVATADLPATSTSWVPPDPLAANSDFSVKVTHETSGSSSPAPRYDPGNVVYEFTFVVTHSDTVAFSTGFAPPSGTFCIVVNDTTPPTLDPMSECTPVVEPAAGILDSSSPPEYVTSAAGITITYSLQLAASGRLSGIAEADLDGDSVLEATELDGRLKGKNGLLRQKIRIPFEVAASDTKLKVRIREEANLAALQGTTALEWLVEQKARGKLNGVKVSEDTTSTPTQTVVTGWKLEFTLTGTEGPITGQLILAGGVSVSLSGSQSFQSESNRSTLKLGSDGADRGIRIELKKLVIDTTKTPQVITSGKLRFRAFGQRGSLLLP